MTVKKRDEPEKPSQGTEEDPRLKEYMKEVDASLARGDIYLMTGKVASEKDTYKLRKKFLRR